jgi:BTB/POZ domain
VVGPADNETRFTVYKDVLSAASAFFEAVCRDEINQTKQEINLPDDDPETIRAMVYWMYHDNICVLESIQMRHYNHATTTADAMETVWGLFAKLYVLGGKYQMPRL